MDMNKDRKHMVNWRQVGLFLGLTCTLSWGINLALALTTGYGSNLGALTALQLQMLMPAFAAISLGMFVFKASPLYFRSNKSATRWFFYAYLLFTLVFAGFAAIAMFQPEAAPAFESIKLILYLVLAVLALVTGLLSRREARANTGFSGGRFKAWVIVWLGFTLFYALQVGLNVFFGLAVLADHSATMAAVGITNPILFALPLVIQNGLVFVLLGIVLAFGEEYGWRFYLQNELIKLGKKRGILLLGVIWAIWHYPAIWMGHNYPGQPVLGTLLMTIFCILGAFILGYIVFKTGSVWLAAFAHGVNNQIYATLTGLIGAPADPIFSFGLGIYGLAMMAVIVALMLRDPVWRGGPARDEIQVTAANAAAAG
jgi:uncharacterized protein